MIRRLATLTWFVLTISVGLNAGTRQPDGAALSEVVAAHDCQLAVVDGAVGYVVSAQLSGADARWIPVEQYLEREGGWKTRYPYLWATCPR